MRTRVAQRRQIKILEEICRKSKILTGDIVEISQEHGKLLIEKVDESWESVMQETKGSWSEHPIFKEMDDAVEMVNCMRGAL